MWSVNVAKHITISCMFVAVLVLLSCLVGSSSGLPTENAMFAYSTVFQGFAALVAVTISGFLLILTHMHTHKKD